VTENEYDPLRHGTGGEITLSIETIALVDESELDHRTPEHWSVFSVAAGYREEGSDGIGTAVFYRHGPTACDEYNLLRNVCDWVRGSEPSRIITFDGLRYDLPIIRDRAHVVSHECFEARSIVDDFDLSHYADEHIDLARTISEDNKPCRSLRNALEQYGISDNNGALADIDVTDIGPQILSGTATDMGSDAIEAHMIAETEMLFKLYDAVNAAD